MEHKAKSRIAKRFREERTKALLDRVLKYRRQRDTLRAYVERDPTIPIREKQSNSEQLLVQVQKLADMWNEVLPHIRKIRPLIDDVLGHNRLVACYLLFGKVSQGVAASFLLLKNGFQYEVIEIIRSNREALDLIRLFIPEPEGSAQVKRWFAGEIVKNARAREVADRQLREFAEMTKVTQSLEGVQDGIYSGLSHYSHVSYGAILDLYDVYHQDVDFEQIAGHHYALKASLPYVRTEIHSVLIVLKAFYLSLGDRESYLRVDALLRKYAPTYYDEKARKKRDAAFAKGFEKRD
jgi:hypothetical protein